MKKLYSILFLTILFVSGVLIALNKDTFSEYEMRNLKEYPVLNTKNIFDGSFGKDFEDALSDRVVGKRYFTSLNSYKDYFLGEREKNGIYLSLKRLTQKPIRNMIVEKILSEKEKYNNLTAYLIPYKLYYEMDLSLPLRALDINSDYRARFDRINEKSDIDFRDVLNVSDFFISDHHLNEKGIKKVLEKLQFKDFAEKKIDDKFLGGEARKSGIILKDNFSVIYSDKTKDLTFKRLSDNKEIEEKIVDFSRVKNVDKYLVYMGGNYGEVNLKGLGEKSLLILKDSFVNPFIGFFAERYGNIKVIDPRFFDGDVFKEIEKVDRVIIFTGI